MEDMSYSSLNSFTKTSGNSNDYQIYSPANNANNPWAMEINTGDGTKQENLNWLI